MDNLKQFKIACYLNACEKINHNIYYGFGAFSYAPEKEGYFYPSISALKAEMGKRIFRRYFPKKLKSHATWLWYNL